MKSAPTISQLQLRAFIIVVMIFILTKVGYQVFIERPHTEETLSLLIKSDLDDIRHDAQRYFSRLEDASYHLATSRQTAEFLQKPNQAFIKQVLADDMFVELNIDGIIFVDKQFNSIYKKGFDHSTRTKIQFELDDFTRFPEHKELFNQSKNQKRFEPISGMISTVKGPAFFSSVQVNAFDDDKTIQGHLVLIRVLDDDFLAQIAQDSYAQLTLDVVNEVVKPSTLKQWTDIPVIGKQHPVNQLVITDFLDKPIAVLTVTHTTSVVSPWVDERGIIYVGILILMLLVWRVWSINKIVSPIQAISSQIKAMRDTLKFQQLNENTHIAELDDFAINFNQLTHTVKLQEKKLNEQVYLDPLTQIANRRAFTQHIERQLNLLKRHDIGFCVILADIDYFKKYNDSLGHQEGDKALIHVAKHLSKFFKRGSDICARFGGEEFIMVFSDVSHAYIAKQLTEIRISLVEEKIIHPDSSVSEYLTISLGACIVDANEKDEKAIAIEDIIEKADQALYQAKKEGRNTEVLFSFNL
ncbi:sensor domain-containing diguanylate cyclase [Litorilituus lipolyticus]|uniref:diguanylate cyclase n=1 Tax=Litorilituus lipolyticus TaxID=2491017 RepID=A0A502L3V7_9GAMM|nr:diguanylate cyclase [Litorilituus lipolyticus]TPH18552.1 diguanylate cyclase [Litorilituus lipolyticus]